jgi:hypothetical protein
MLQLLQQALSCSACFRQQWRQLIEAEAAP